NIADIERITEKLQYHHYKAYKIFGRESKEDRQRALEGFRSGEIQVLVASGIAARGLDIKDVTHVFNLDLPEDAKEYLNRTGRTGRNGQMGTAVSIITKREISIVKSYERELNITIDKKKIFKGVIA
ncbi:MAG: C-terminal helicase domain-containing protein, partial [Desulfotomaculaceae bacterium]